MTEKIQSISICRFIKNLSAFSPSWPHESTHIYKIRVFKQTPDRNTADKSNLDVWKETEQRFDGFSLLRPLKPAEFCKNLWFMFVNRFKWKICRLNKSFIHVFSSVIMKVLSAMIHSGCRGRAQRTVVDIRHQHATDDQRGCN